VASRRKTPYAADHFTETDLLGEPASRLSGQHGMILTKRATELTDRKWIHEAETLRTTTITGASSDTCRAEEKFFDQGQLPTARAKTR
jgi:hypothetical protein